MKDIHQDKILILDFGSQYTQLIARRIREMGVYCEIYPYQLEATYIEKFQPKGIILSGGPESVTLKNTPRANDIVFSGRWPVLGICYGMQTMAEQLGGKVQASSSREFGYAAVEIAPNHVLLDNIEDRNNEQGMAILDVWMSHGDQVVELPPGFSSMGKTESVAIAAMADESRHFYGLQFHPEVTHTHQGNRILERFVKKICGCDALWQTENIIAELIEKYRQQIGSDRVILALSGGVDSSVVAVLLHRAIGEQLHCVFVDHGLLRLGEAEQVQQTFAKHFGIPLTTVSAQEQFFNALKGVDDPEHKRKIIGKTFIDVFSEQAQLHSDAKWLAQGTIYPDVIESGGQAGGQAHVIKSHHNVGGLPKDMNLKLVEPLRELFKDEVRKLGLELGLPYDMLYRHPFPGPGLGIRILGEIQADYADKLRKADAIFIEELRNHDLYDKVSQAFCVFLPVKSVGVIGDARQYEPIIALRAVETIDFMTAHWARLPYDFLAHVSLRIINEVAGISRVVYDISGKPPATIEWE